MGEAKAAADDQANGGDVGKGGGVFRFTVLSSENKSNKGADLKACFYWHWIHPKIQMSLNTICPWTI